MYNFKCPIIFTIFTVLFGRFIRYLAKVASIKIALKLNVNECGYTNEIFNKYINNGKLLKQNRKLKCTTSELTSYLTQIRRQFLKISAIMSDIRSPRVSQYCFVSEGAK